MDKRSGLHIGQLCHQYQNQINICVNPYSQGILENLMVSKKCQSRKIEFLSNDTLFSRMSYLEESVRNMCRSLLEYQEDHPHFAYTNLFIIINPIMNSLFDDVKYIPIICESTIARFYKAMMDAYEIILPKCKIITISPSSSGWVPPSLFSASVESMKKTNERVSHVIY